MEEKPEVNELFRVFYEGNNPGINFGNVTSRKAAEWLIRRYGLEKAKATAEYAVSLTGKKYAPVITTPYQLKEKLGQLIAYYESNKPKPKVLSL